MRDGACSVLRWGDRKEFDHPSEVQPRRLGIFTDGQGRTLGGPSAPCHDQIPLLHLPTSSHCEVLRALSKHHARLLHDAEITRGQCALSLIPSRQRSSTEHMQSSNSKDTTDGGNSVDRLKSFLSSVRLSKENVETIGEGWVRTLTTHAVPVRSLLYGTQ